MAILTGISGSLGITPEVGSQKNYSGTTMRTIALYAPFFSVRDIGRPEASNTGEGRCEICTLISVGDVNLVS